MREWVWVGGTFDLPHVGHIRLLERASKHGKVVVALNDDVFAAEYKRKPIMPLAERMEIISSIRYVDKTIINIGGADSKHSMEIFGAHRLRYICHGDDWPRPQYLLQLGLGEGWLERNGVELLYLPYTRTVSSTMIEERVLEMRS